MERPRHAMVLENTHPSGAEDWYCPTCGRRMTITWQPWKKIILDPGDIHAAHGGSKGGLHVGSFQITQGTADTSVDDPYLAPWRRWLDNGDRDDFWDNEA